MATGRIGTTPVLTTRWSKAPSAGTTSLSGLDDNSVSLVYSVGYEAVYRNGVLLSRTNDYTATNGTTITLIDATIAGDIIEVFANQTIPLADTYSQTVANGKFINNTLTTTTGDIIYASAANTPARLGIGSTDQVLKVSGGVPVWGAASAASFVGCILKKTSGGQTVASGVKTAMLFNSEVVDTDAFHDTSSNTSRITIPTGKGGKYLFCLNVAQISGAYNIQVYVNGTSGSRVGNISLASGAFATLSLLLNLSAADYVEIYFDQSTGSTQTIYDETNGATGQANFSCQYLGA